jgi:hypothetical protein
VIPFVICLSLFSRRGPFSDSAGGQFLTSFDRAWPGRSLPPHGRGFPRAVGGDGGQDGPIFNAKKKIGCLAVPPTNGRGTTGP